MESAKERVRLGAPSAAEVLDLRGRTVVVTGGSDGVGRAAIVQLVRAGAAVVMVGRNEAKTRSAASSIMSLTGRRAIDVEIADLSLQEDVRALAERLRQRHENIHVLINNAGALFMDRKLTPEGIERTFALNHLAYFTLSLLLVDRLVAAASPGAPARLINVSSRAHVNARLRLNDLQYERGYRGWRAYRASKLCNVLFTRALARRIDRALLVTHAVHPGLVSTRFAKNNGAIGRLMRRAMDVASITPEQGADTMVWLSGTAEAVKTSGDYWVRRERVQPSSYALDDASGEALWNASAALSGLDADSIIRDAVAAKR
jgi:NAD(P)-dependent dehydrogenase (short-subunit alcohol dehydrogenase family)